VDASAEGRAPPRFLPGLAPLASDFDALLLDQWGVLHDGHQAYDDAVEALQRLRTAGKAVLLLSNTARRGSDNLQLLQRLGFAGDLFDGVVSAGDDARDALLHDPDPFYRGLGRRCGVLSRPGDRALAEGLGFDVVDDPAQADWLLLLSSEPPQQSLAAWQTLLAEAARRGLPMVCANPDLDRATADGRLLEAPGRVAQHYESLGGVVRWHGKPQLRIYATCLQRLGLVRSRILAVGDSLPHDVAGALGAGVPSAWVAGGVHAAEVEAQAGRAPDPARCLALFGRTGLWPDFVLPRFRW
jgi:HAD superfamily hydrolase (TIGR01459 family)